jgi:hypothetical protein
LAERIISEADVHQLLAHERRPRNKMLLLLIYAAGLRVSEACGLAWRDVVGRDDGGQITVFGKGGKTRTILLPASVYDQLDEIPPLPWTNLSPPHTDARTRLHCQDAQLPQVPRAVQERMVRRASVQTLQEPQQLARGYDFGAGVRSRKSPLERTLAGILPSISRRRAIARVRMVRIRTAFVRNTSPPRHEAGNDIRPRVA